MISIKLNQNISIKEKRENKTENINTVWKLTSGNNVLKYQHIIFMYIRLLCQKSFTLLKLIGQNERTSQTKLN